MIRSALAVLAGLVAITVTSFTIEAGANPLLMRIFPDALPNQAALSRNVPAWLFMLAYTLLCVAGGRYLTARLAGHSPVRHAVILGVLQSALMVPAMIAFPDQAPLSRWIVGMVLVVPAAWCGGVIYARRAQGNEPPREGNARAIA
jgi:hypothetical protein